MKSNVLTTEQMTKLGADVAEIAKAQELFRVLRPCLKVKSDSGKVETTHGDKNILGLYRTVKDIVAPPDKRSRVTKAIEALVALGWKEESAREMITGE